MKAGSAEGVFCAIILGFPKLTELRPCGHASLPVAFRLYLPEPWAKDVERRMKAGVPADIAFQTKPQIALDQIRGPSSLSSLQSVGAEC